MGPYLAQPKTEQHYHSNYSQNTRVGYSFAEMQGWRRFMEDAAIHEVDIGDGNSLFAVFDGHGGAEVSKFVGQVFTSQLINSQFYREGRYEEALVETFRRIDELIQSREGVEDLKMFRNNSDAPSLGQNRVSDVVGCTGNVLLITKKSIIVANAGDSRSVLCRNGRAIQLSFDHKPENPIESQRIARANGRIENGRVNGGLNLTRSFGDFAFKQDRNRPYDEQLIICKPDVKEYMRNNEDEFIIIGCDGIFERYIHDCQPLVTKVQEELRKGIDGVSVMRSLLDNLLAKDNHEEIGCDNMTCMVIQFY